MPRSAATTAAGSAAGSVWSAARTSAIIRQGVEAPLQLLAVGLVMVPVRARSRALGALRLGLRAQALAIHLRFPAGLLRHGRTREVCLESRVEASSLLFDDVVARRALHPVRREVAREGQPSRGRPRRRHDTR